jgi:hypothetical protein
MEMSESLVGSSSEVSSPVSFTTIENMEDKIKEPNKILGNLDLGETMDYSDFSKKFSRNTAADFTTRSGGVSNNVHQVCVIITKEAEDNDDVDTHEPRRRRRKYMSLPKNGE